MPDFIPGRKKHHTIDCVTFTVTLGITLFIIWYSSVNKENCRTNQFQQKVDSYEAKD